MTALLLVLLIQVAQAAPFWPQTGSGWIMLAIAILGAAYVAYDRVWAKGKRDEQLNEMGKRLQTEINGLGKRVEETEVWQEREDAGATNRALIEQNFMRTQQDTLVQLGEAQTMARQCQAEIREIGEELKKLIERKHEQSDAWERRLSMQVSNLEVELRSRGILSAQAPSSPPLPRPPLTRDD